jgi:hypothetical protein
MGEGVRRADEGSGAALDRSLLLFKSVLLPSPSHLGLRHHIKWAQFPARNHRLVHVYPRIFGCSSDFTRLQRYIHALKSFNFFRRQVCPKCRHLEQASLKPLPSDCYGATALSFSRSFPSRSAGKHHTNFQYSENRPSRAWLRLDLLCPFSIPPGSPNCATCAAPALQVL